jgi:hypothetical protein
MRCKLKPPGTKRLKLNCDIPHSNYDLKVKLRRYSKAALDASRYASAAVPVGGLLPTITRATLNRPISVYRFPRGALTLCPQLCMGIRPGARFPARSADALPATLYWLFAQAMYRNRPVSSSASLDERSP